MLNQLKTEECYNQNEADVYHDAHIRAYHAQNMGIKLVVCDLGGVPVSESLVPIASYLPDTSYNM